MRVECGPCNSGTELFLLRREGGKRLDGRSAWRGFISRSENRESDAKRRGIAPN